MSTVVRRTFASTPSRDAQATWRVIVDLLTCGEAGERRDELLSVAGVAAATIIDQAPRQAPIVVTCDGPRTRIYCLFDDDALDSSEANEDPLGFDPLKGDWAVSLPCLPEDLDWVRTALREKTKRVTARDLNESTAAAQDTGAAAIQLTLNERGFLGS